MGSKYKENFECIIQDLRNFQGKIIVEGKKDKKALELLGATNIVTIDKPLYKIIEAIDRECIVLTDLDKHGKKLYKFFKNNLQKRGVKVNDRFRNFLYRETNLAQIEGLPSYLNKI